MQITQKVLGDRLRTARETCGMTQETAAEKLGVSRPTVAQMELGNRAVTSIELHKLAYLFGHDISFFFKKEFREDGALSTLLHKIPEVSTQPESLETIRSDLAVGRERTRLEKLLDIHREHVSAVSYQLRSLESRWDAIQQGEMVAEEERRRLDLGSSAIKDLVGLLEWQGVRSTFIKLPDDISGLTVQEESVGYFAIINAAHTSPKKRFSLAHEHAHVLIDRSRLGQVSRSGTSEDLTELRANVFAAAFLMPKNGITQFISGLGKGRPSRSHAEVFDEGENSLRVFTRPIPGSQTLQLIEVVLLAHHFKVSPLAALYRLYNLRLIPEKQLNILLSKIEEGLHETLFSALSLIPFEIEETGEAHRRRFLRLILEALRISIVDVDEYLQLAQMVGMAPGEAMELAQLTGYRTGSPKDEEITIG